MNIRLLKFIVIAMGILILVGTTVVGVTIVNRVAARTDAGSETTAQIPVSLPEGARIVETALADDRLALRIETKDGPRILIVDLITGTLISTVEIEEARP